MGRESSPDLEVIEAVRRVSDRLTLRIVEAMAHEKLENARLMDEHVWLKRRISEEDERLAHA